MELVGDPNDDAWSCLFNFKTKDEKEKQKKGTVSGEEQKEGDEKVGKDVASDSKHGKAEEELQEPELKETNEVGSEGVKEDEVKNGASNSEQVVVDSAVKKQEGPKTRRKQTEKAGIMPKKKVEKKPKK